MKNRINMILFICSLVIIIISGLMFCFSLYGKDSHKSIILTYMNNKELKIDNSSPITEKLGKNITFNKGDYKTGYMEFSLSSNSGYEEVINYEICIVNNSESELSKYVKFYLTDYDTDKPVLNFDKNIPTFLQLKKSKSLINGKSLYIGKLSGNETKRFRLRIWLDDSYTITDKSSYFAADMVVNVLN